MPRSESTSGALARLSLALCLALAGCSAERPDGAGSTQPSSGGPSSTDATSGPVTDPDARVSPSRNPSGAGSPSASTAGDDGVGVLESPEVVSRKPPPTRGPVRLARWFDREFTGRGLRLGTLRESTDAFRSYNVSYRSEGLRITGVINIPRGRGPFPAVVLAHGYIDPAVYVRGQGMPRERRVLAESGFIALHVDYRNHAGSDDDPALRRSFRMGYAVDVVNAVHALRATGDLPVEPGRIALFGRSMGGGVVYKALEMAPGVADAAVAWAAVSSDEADNYRQFAGPSPFWDYVRGRWGTPAENPGFWARISPDGHFDRISEPVLLVHGTADTTCTPRWARQTYRGMRRAGVSAVLTWYEGEGHTFEAAFDRAMARTMGFLERQMG